jgi:hypothetical protein
MISRKFFVYFKHEIYIFFMKIFTFIMSLSLIFWVFRGPATQADQYNMAVLQGLDKVTARVSTFNAPVGSAINFGSLEIVIRTCYKRPPEETPESAAFIDVWEMHPGEPAASIYRGWMFASSPALAAIEHPVYDVWVLDCKNVSLDSLVK